MNRREFHRNVVGAALGLGVPGLGMAQAQEPAMPEAAAQAPFRMSIMLWTVFRDLGFEERLEKVAEAGYRNVELVGEFEKWSENDWRNALRKQRELGITFDTTGGVPHSNEKVGLADPAARDQMLEDLRNLLPTCERLGCRQIILMSGNIVPGLTHQQQHQSCIEGLKRAAAIIQGKDFELLVENIDPEEDPRYFLTSATECFDVVRAVNHPQVRVLYDFYHAQISDGNLIEKLEKNIDLVGLCHIADVPGRHEPGTGEINYINIYKKLASMRYDRYVAMEYLPTYNPLESLKMSREQALRTTQSQQTLWTPSTTS